MIDHVLITGGAGFIGSHLADRLLARGHRVTVYDNLSTGFVEFLEDARRQPGFTLIEGDLLDEAGLAKALSGCDLVFHLAANADVRFGTAQPRRDLEQNTIATFNLLEAMRANGVRRIAFASTGSIYGETSVIPTPEDAPFPVQTSLYGASKLAGEGLIAAYCEGFEFQSWIFRFVSIVGERYTHGHVFDFYKSLARDPTTLHVLGNGRQTKSYLYVEDCVEAMLAAVVRAKDKVNVFNLGTEEYVQVEDSIAIITAHLGLSPRRTYAGGERGWVGDNPFIFLDTTRIRALGWAPRVDIRQGIIRTVDWLKANPWIYERRT
ncbi:MAG TPA: NAD-dependent epimerase/dehydratase family protein [Alphaproteobacteria bacterium]|nr:NAD-dependent epimerase/dehydratase family protein [Alphaproteobacteria bacterium]